MLFGLNTQLDLFADASGTGIKDVSNNSTITDTCNNKAIIGEFPLPEISTFGDIIKRIQYYYDKYPIYTAVILVAHIGICIIALMLATECNQYESVYMKIAVAIIAFLFGEIYIIYYAIYHIFAGVRCYNPPVYGNISRYSSFAQQPVAASASQ
jgi:hypothetical protein